MGAGTGDFAEEPRAGAPFCGTSAAVDGRDGREDAAGVDALELPGDIADDLAGPAVFPARFDVAAAAPAEPEDDECVWPRRSCDLSRSASWPPRFVASEPPVPLRLGTCVLGRDLLPEVVTADTGVPTRPFRSWLGIDEVAGSALDGRGLLLFALAALPQAADRGRAVYSM